MRAERGAANTLTTDAGDTIQAHPWPTVSPRSAPFPRRSRTPWRWPLTRWATTPSAWATTNSITAPLLRTWERQLDFPLLGANVHDAVTGKRAFAPYVLKRVKTDNGWLTVGLVGFVTPGCALRDRDNVQLTRLG